MPRTPIRTFPFSAILARIRLEASSSPSSRIERIDQFPPSKSRSRASSPWVGLRSLDVETAEVSEAVRVLVACGPSAGAGAESIWGLVLGASLPA